MKTIEKIASAENFSAVNVGSFATLGDYLLQMGPDVKIPGKVFCGAAVQATGSEFSFQSFARVPKPDSSTPTRTTKSSTSSFRATVSFRSTARFSPSPRAVSYALPPQGAARCATTALSRS